VAEGIRLLTKKDSDHLGPNYVKQYLTSEIKRWSQPNKPDVRVQELGYTVRGVPPSQFDVWLGARLGASAVQSLFKGKSNCMIGWEEKRGIVKTPFETVVKMSNRPPKEIWTDRPAWQEVFYLQQSLACPPPMCIGGNLP
jgi:6-phosphofructokinase